MPSDGPKLLEEAKKKMADQLNELYNKKDYSGIVNLMIDVVKENMLDPRNRDGVSVTVSQKKYEALREFFEFHTRTNDQFKIIDGAKFYEIDPAEHEFVTQMIRHIDDAWREATVSFGKKEDAWKKKIKDGKIADTELIKDEPDVVGKLAHLINVEVNLSDPAVYDARKDFVVQNFANKTIGGVKAADYINSDIERATAEVAAKNNLSNEKMKAYVKTFNERDGSKSTGYKIKDGLPEEPAENEYLFQELPDYLVNIRNNPSEEQLEAHERTLMEKIHMNERYVQKMQSVVDITKHLHSELKGMADEMTEQGDEPEYWLTYSLQSLESFTHVGKDYYLNVDAPNCDQISPRVITDVTGKVSISSTDFMDETKARVDQHIEEGTLDSKQGRFDGKLAQIASDVHFLNMLAKTQSDKHFKTMINSGEIEKVNKEISYMNKYRKMMGFFVAGKPVQDSYTKTLDKLTDMISDSLANDCVSPECYDKLILNTKEHKRIYQKMRDAEKQGNSAVYNRYKAKLDETRQTTDQLIAECKDFETTNGKQRSITGKTTNRDKLMGKLSEAVSKQFGEPEKNFESYIRMHTGEYGGKTDKERRANMTKVLAAYTLKKLDQPFNVKEIHKTAEYIKGLYMLDDSTGIIGGQNALENAMKSKESVLAAGEKVRRQIYDVKDRKYDQFSADMKTLLGYMRSADGRSKEYTSFYNAVKAASELTETTKDMTPSKKAAAYRQTNIDIIYTIQKYVKGKEKVRISNKGNDAFSNAMDALSVISKYTKEPGQQINIKVVDVVGNINKIRKDPELDNSMTFEQRFGLENAKRVHDMRTRRQAANNKSGEKKAQGAPKVPGAGGV